MPFIRQKEDFVCQVCEAKVRGTGYTNHCPHCLWSKHVDEQGPGDRLSTCQGLMKPVGAETKGGRYVIIHQCQKCGKIIKNKAAENDSFEGLLKLSQNK